MSIEESDEFFDTGRTKRNFPPTTPQPDKQDINNFQITKKLKYEIACCITAYMARIGIDISDEQQDKIQSEYTEELIESVMDAILVWQANEPLKEKMIDIPNDGYYHHYSDAFKLLKRLMTPLWQSNADKDKEIVRLKKLLEYTATKFYQKGMSTWVDVVGSKRLSTNDDFKEMNERLKVRWQQFKSENQL